MSVVVKIGGASFERPGMAVSRIQEVIGAPKIIVHGGGVQITRMMERMKIEPRFVEGLRVTDEQTIRAVAAALLGEVHPVLIAALRNAAVPAIGMFGVITATQRAGPWGLVGTDVQTNAAFLRAVVENGHVPVIPTLALGPESLLNVNGDEAAAAVAVALKADALVFLTDVEGVKNAAGRVYDRGPDPASLLSSAFVSGGMIPKLRAVQTAIAGGVGHVRVGRTVFGSTS